jgi:hypothetical protein
MDQGSILGQFRKKQGRKTRNTVLSSCAKYSRRGNPLKPRDTFFNLKQCEKPAMASPSDIARQVHLVHFASGQLPLFPRQQTGKRQTFVCTMSKL